MVLWGDGVDDSVLHNVLASAGDEHADVGEIVQLDIGLMWLWLSAVLLVDAVAAIVMIVLLSFGGLTLCTGW